MEYRINYQYQIAVMKMSINNFILINPKKFKIFHCKIFKIISRYYKNCNTKDKMQRQESDFKITPLVLLVNIEIIRKTSFQELICSKIIQSFTARLNLKWIRNNQDLIVSKYIKITLKSQQINKKWIKNKYRKIKCLTW